MSDKVYELHAQMCKIFTSPKRLEILSLLNDKELSVSELMELAKINQANLSQHLSILREKDIVRTRRDGVRIFYSLIDKRIVQAFEIIRNVLMDKLARTEQLSKNIRKTRKRIVP